MEALLSKEISPYSMILLSYSSRAVFESWNGTKYQSILGPSWFTTSLASSPLLMPFATIQTHICVFEYIVIFLTSLHVISLCHGIKAHHPRLTHPCVDICVPTISGAYVFSYSFRRHGLSVVYVSLFSKYWEIPKAQYQPVTASIKVWIPRNFGLPVQKFCMLKRPVWYIFVCHLLSTALWGG